MLSLRKAIEEALTNNRGRVNWLIIHDLKDNVNDPGVSFSFITNERSDENPFDLHQGYICIASSGSAGKVKTLLTGLVDQHRGDLHALANIFIIANRLSSQFEEEFEEFMVSLFTPREREEVYALLCVSLNAEYYKGLRSHISEPIDLDSWLHLFRSVQFRHGFSNPVLAIVQLVWDAENQQIEHRHIKQMASLIRAELASFFGISIAIGEADLSTILSDPLEYGFVIASILDNNEAYEETTWLTTDLLKPALGPFWATIGKTLLQALLGPAQHRRSRKWLCSKVIESLNGEYQTRSPEELPWLNKIEFPNGFITVFNWVVRSGTDLHASHIEHLQQELLTGYGSMVSSAQMNICEDTRTDPFMHLQNSQEAYDRFFACSLWLIIHDMRSLNRIRTILYDLKMLYFGGYSSQRYALRYTEVLLYTTLAIDKLRDIEEKDRKIIGALAGIMADTVIVPYVHLIEREQEIWSNRTSPSISHQNGLTRKIQDVLSRHYHDPDQNQYAPIFDAITNTKVAKWPFEKVAPSA